MKLYFSKLYVFSLLTILRLISGLSPLIISKKIKRKYGVDNLKTWIEKSVSCSMDFSGGILLATCFIHMIPEVRHNLLACSQHEHHEDEFPFAETLVCIGFFIVFFVEESVRQMFTIKPLHSHVKKPGALISSKLQETPDNKLDDDVAQANMDSGDSNGHGMTLTSAVSAAATNGLMFEMNSMIRDDVNECNNNLRSVNARNLRNFLLITALSFHSIMEGLAIGLEQTVEKVWFLFLAVSVHECTILLCIGIEMVATCPSTSTVIIYIVIFAMVSPVGVLFGSLITFFVSETNPSQTQFTIVGSLQGLAAGTILYVTFFEVLNNHKHNHHGRTHQSKSEFPKIFFVALGFVFMVVIELIGGHSSGMHHDGAKNCSS